MMEEYYSRACKIYLKIS